MDRRTFIGLLAYGVVVEPRVATAQKETAVRRIGWLMFGEPPPPAVLEQRNAPLRELGWIEGQNLLIERRNANNRAELLQPLAEELVRLKVELIVTNGTNVTLAARNATAIIPIVMYSAGDPVAAGLVARLARPGGNVTGNSLLFTSASITGRPASSFTPSTDATACGTDCNWIIEPGNSRCSTSLSIASCARVI